MCTPTATPPIWLTHGHPERMHVNEKGRRWDTVRGSMPAQTIPISESGPG
ncbi:beta-galactosidase [Bacillus licheniformis]|nr:beta-galactosidase [Bacillus licheniformis]